MKKTTANSGRQRKDGMPRGTPFEKGKSGNPSGRPKGWPEFEAKCRAHSDEAIEVLINLLRTGEERTQLEAAKTLLDRAWGKAKQQIEHSGKDGEKIEIRVEDVARELKRMVEGSDD